MKELISAIKRSLKIIFHIALTRKSWAPRWGELDNCGTVQGINSK